MKELYTSPELRLLCFAAAESLASDQDLDFSDFFEGNNPVSTQDGDINIPLPLLPKK